MAPITPFITEELYQLFYKKFEQDTSIHVSNWPDLDIVDEDAEKVGDCFIYALQHVRRAKSEQSKSMKDPVKKVLIKAKFNHELFKKAEADFRATTSAEEIIFEELPADQEMDYEVVVDLE